MNRNTIKLNGLTAKQQARLAKAEAKLPEGFYYRLHDTNDKHERVDVWGVSVYNDELSPGGDVAYAAKPKKGFISAHTSVAEEQRETVRLILNRACAALWHSQPRME